MQRARAIGFELRDAFEQQLKGLETRCRECHKLGLIGKDLHVVYTESDTLFGRDYSV